MRRQPKTCVARVPVELKQYAKDWQRLMGSSKEVDGWKQVHKLCNVKSKKIYPEMVFKL